MFLKYYFLASSEYELYFDEDVRDIPLATVSGDVSIAFWVRSFYVPLVIIDVDYNNGDKALRLETSSEQTISINDG